MNRRTFIGTVSVIGTSLAGCMGQRRAPAESTDASPSNTVTPADTVTSSKNITPYEALTAQGKELFQQMLETGEITKPINEIPAPLVNAEYIRYNGTVYSVAKERGYIAERVLEYQTVPQSNIEQSKLVTYANLTADAKEVFDEMLATGRYSVRGETLPSQLTGYVECQETYHKVWKVTGDIQALHLSISKAETGDSDSPPASETRTPSNSPSPSPTPAGPFEFATVHNTHDTPHRISITITRVSSGATVFETDRQIAPGYENHFEISDEWLADADTYQVQAETEDGLRTTIEVDVDERWACDHSVGIEITDDGELISTLAVGEGKRC